MTKITEVLDYLEENLDPIHIDNVKVHIKKTLNYQQTDRIAINVYRPFETGFEYYPYIEAFTDMNKMMVNELIPCCGNPNLKADYIPMIRANFGVGTLPSLFGLKCKVLENNLPWVEHTDVKNIMSLLNKGVPSLQSGLGGRALETIDFYHKQLSAFPKCRDLIKIYHPDLQGPFDVAHLIWGSDIYMAVYDEPEMVHELLQLVTETYISYMKELKKVLNDEDGEFNYHWGTLFPGKVLLRDDSPVVLSKDMYEEFVQPYDEQILKAFGGGSIHYCGRGDQWVFKMMETKGLKGLNFGQPPNMEFGIDFIEKLHNGLKVHKIAVCSYYIDSKDVGRLVNSEFSTGITFSSNVNNLKEAQDILNLVGYN